MKNYEMKDHEKMVWAAAFYDIWNRSYIYEPDKVKAIRHAAVGADELIQFMVDRGIFPTEPVR